MRPLVGGQNPDLILVVESELDAILVAQEAGDLCTVVAMGSAANHPDQETEELIRRAKSF